LLSNVNQSTTPTTGGSSQTAPGKAPTTVTELNQSYPGSHDNIYPSQDPLRAVDYPQQTRLESIDQIMVRARSEEVVEEANQQITDLLRRRHHIKAGQADDFSVRDTSEMSRALASTEKQARSIMTWIWIVVVGGGTVCLVAIVALALFFLRRYRSRAAASAP
jgi:chaperonin GroEL (HSP60 family)